MKNEPTLNMTVSILTEAGYNEALLGLSLSHNAPIDRMPRVAHKLAPKDGGHNKILESISVWMDIKAPRYWWQEFDTYRVGVTKQSESTMHTLMKRELTQEDFVEPISGRVLTVLNEMIQFKEFRNAKVHLPEGFLQRRIVCTNYKALRHIILQRYRHRLPEWQVFVRGVMGGLEHPDLLGLDEGFKLKGE